MPTRGQQTGLYERMAKGYVYAVRVPGDEAVKIGRTGRSFEKRLRELNGPGLKVDLVPEYVCKVSDPAWVEKCAHDLLKDCRVRPDKEFFRCKRSKAIRAINRAAKTARPHHARVVRRGSSSGLIRRLFSVLGGLACTVCGLGGLGVMAYVGFTGSGYLEEYRTELATAVCFALLLLVSGVKTLRSPT